MALLTITLALALAATSLGMLVGSLAPISKQAKNIGMLLGFVLMFATSFIIAFSLEITGTNVDIQLPSEGFSYYLSHLTPHAHAANGYIKLIFSARVLRILSPISSHYWVLQQSS